MKEILNKKTLGHLAELARVDLKAGEEAKMLKDLEAILEYFQELQAVDTANAEPMTGGTRLQNIAREDQVGAIDDIGKGAEAFPQEEQHYLKVPPVF